MGELAYYLYNAILLTKNKKGMTKDEFKEYFRDKSEEEKVKEIFIDNFYINYDQNKKNKLSKAEVALNLSYLLKEDKENTKEILLKDEYCKYIVEAIEYATGNIHIEGSNKND